MLTKTPDKAICGEKLFEIRQKMKLPTFEFFQNLMNKLNLDYRRWVDDMLDRENAHFDRWT